jgi:tripartite motif-containing protein 71
MASIQNTPRISSSCQRVKYLQYFDLTFAYHKKVEILASGEIGMRLGKFLSYGLFVISILLMSFSPVGAQWDETDSAPLTLVWEMPFTAEAPIITPSDFVVDAWGNIYVSTQADTSIKKFDSEGNFVTSWGPHGTEEGELSFSAGISVDADGNVYVADFGNTRVQVFDSDGNFLRLWATEPPAGPASVTVDAEGFVTIDNFSAHAHYIQRFDNEGNLVNQWGTSGSGEGQFVSAGQSGPEDITVDQEGNIYVADRLNNRIQKFDSEGNFLAAFGGEPDRDGVGGGQFYMPSGIAVDGEGNIYVLDAHFIQKLDRDGNFLAQWSTDGGDLDHARVLAVNAQGDIFTFVRIEVTTATGNTLRVFVVRRFEQA